MIAEKIKALYALYYLMIMFIVLPAFIWGTRDISLKEFDKKVIGIVIFLTVPAVPVFVGMLFHIARVLSS